MGRVAAATIPENCFLVSLEKEDLIFVKAGGLSAYHTSHCVDLSDDDTLCGREGGGCYLPQSNTFFSLVDSELLTTLVGDDMLS